MSFQKALPDAITTEYMELNRRQTLLLVGTSLSTTAISGCLSTAGPSDGTDNNDPTENNNSDGSDPPASPDNRRPRIDEPPYDISEPPCGDDNDRDPLWLCDGMSAEPTVDFDQVPTSSPILADEGLRSQEGDDTAEYYATFLTEKSNMDRLHHEASEAAVELVEDTAFDTEAILIAQAGWGSGSKTPHLKRIEDASTGIHAYGCLRQPCVWTDDYTVRTVIARFNRPTSLEGSRVSITVDPETRVTFDVYDW